MRMRCVGPTPRWQRDQLMRKVAEDVDLGPVEEAIKVGVTSSVQESKSRTRRLTRAVNSGLGTVKDERRVMGFRRFLY